MNLSQINQKLELLCDGLTAKDYCVPVAYFKTTFGGRIEVFWMAQQNRRYDMDETVSKSSYADDLDKAFDAAFAALDELVPMQQLKREKFLKRMADTLEQARDLGLDTVPDTDNGNVINYVDALEAMMKSLSHNILTHDKRLDAAE